MASENFNHSLQWRPIQMPKLLISQKNGELDSSILSKVRGGYLLSSVASKWDSIRHCASQEGLVLLPQQGLASTYRSAQVQERIFLQNHEQCPADEHGAIEWNGAFWKLKSNGAPVPVPGECLHGWGLAINVQLDTHGRLIDFLARRAIHHGFCWENEKTPERLICYAADHALATWDEEFLSSSSEGQWIRRPNSTFSARGVSTWAGSCREGDAVVLASNSKERGISANTLAKLPFEPAAIITSLSLDALDRLLPPALGAAPVLQIKNTTDSLLDFARAARRQFKGKVIGVTGSAGKTTTVHMLSHILGCLGQAVPHSRANANLPYGVAWNLCQMPWEADYYALELAVGSMGVNTRLARPHVAIITNIAAAHLVYHGSTKLIAIKKSRIFEGVVDGGCAVICRDTEHVNILIRAAESQGLRVITYGWHPDADFAIQRTNVSSNQVSVSTPVGKLEFDFPMDGDHMILNAMACLATGFALGVDLDQLVPAFGTFEAVSGRGARHELQLADGTFCLIDESYNANPLSMRAAIQASGAVFKKKGYRRHVMVLGDMLELGSDEVKLHTELVPAILSQPPDVLLLCGPLMSNLAVPALINSCQEVLPLASPAEVTEWTSNNLRDGDLVLVKSSHGTGLHQVVEALLSRSQ